MTWCSHDEHFYVSYTADFATGDNGSCHFIHIDETREVICGSAEGVDASIFNSMEVLTSMGTFHEGVDADEVHAWCTVDVSSVTGVKLAASKGTACVGEGATCNHVVMVGGSELMSDKSSFHTSYGMGDSPVSGSIVVTHRGRLSSDVALPVGVSASDVTVALRD